jgi:hypothetical protein
MMEAVRTSEHDKQFGAQTSDHCFTLWYVKLQLIAINFKIPLHTLKFRNEYSISIFTYTAVKLPRCAKINTAKQLVKINFKI